MRRAVFLNKLEEIMEAPEGSLKGDEKLADLPRWDSMTVVQFIALVDEDFGMPVSASDLLKAQTLPDLMNLLGDKITD
jgi:acyl carrier protein